MSNMKVSFVVIALNAASTLDALLACLGKQTYPHGNIEVLLIDSGSSDHTREIMLAFQNAEHDFDRIVVLDNPKRTLPCGWNVALEALSGDAVLRVDAHVTFPPDFIERNVQNLENGENICGGKVISVPAEKTKWSITLNEAENSMFGGSFAAFRHADSARYVSTAAFAIYRKTVFDQVGRYNETLTRTEDNEMHYRMRQAGFRFFYDPAIISYRKTRATLRNLLKQKNLNGYWIGRTMGVEPRCFSLYHFVPFAFVLAVLGTAVLAAFGFKWPALLLWTAYLLADCAMTIFAVVGTKERNLYLLTLPLLFLLLHLWYGVGTLTGLAGMILRKAGP